VQVLTSMMVGVAMMCQNSIATVASIVFNLFTVCLT